jgi:ubiquinone/menaquinone biosynthesis C-methylase UbiE
MIKKCKSHAGLSCVLGSADRIPFPDCYFDKVIIVDAFHHFQNQEMFAKKSKGF